MGAGLSGGSSLTFLIDPHGRVVPQDDEARRALADRAGHFALLPAAADLLVARRTHDGLAAPPVQRCLLAGDVSAFALGDFVAFIHQSRLSGVLTVSGAGVERAVAFKDGEVRGARSSAPGERLVEVAARLGYVERGAVPDDGGEHTAAKALVAKGVAESDVWKCLHAQVAAVFQGLLLAREGVFAMVDEGDAGLGTPLSVSTQSLLMDAIRRIDEVSLFRARIPGPQALLRRREPRRPTTLRPPEKAVLDLVDGVRTVADVAQAAHLDEFDATKLLYHLAEAGYVDAGAQPAARPTGDERLAAIASGLNGILREIAAAASAAGALDRVLTGVRAYLGDASGRYAALWTLVPPGADGALEEGAVLGNLSALRGAALSRLEPTGDPGRLLFDALRDLMFFYLFLAAARLPRDADERLAGEVKRRLEALAPLR